MKTPLLFILLTLSTLLYAEDYDTFIGIEVGRTTLNIEDDISDNGINYGARIGFIRDTGRVFLSLNSATLDDTDIVSAAFNFDAITPRAYRFNEYFSVRAFVGLHGGFTKHSPDVLDDDEGVMGGGQAGLLLDFPADITLEVGYKATWADINYGPLLVENCQNIYLAFDFVF